MVVGDRLVRNRVLVPRLFPAPGSHKLKRLQALEGQAGYAPGTRHKINRLLQLSLLPRGFLGHPEGLGGKKVKTRGAWGGSEGETGGEWGVEGNLGWAAGKGLDATWGRRQRSVPRFTSEPKRYRHSLSMPGGSTAMAWYCLWIATPGLDTSLDVLDRHQDEV